MHPAAVGAFQGVSATVTVPTMTRSSSGATLCQSVAAAGASLGSPLAGAAIGASLASPVAAAGGGSSFGFGGLSKGNDGLLPDCTCCKPPPRVRVGDVRLACQALVVHADPEEVNRVPDSHIEAALWKVFGEEGLRRLFGCAELAGARRIHDGGLNHIFMVAHAGRLLKCMRPRGEHFSEVREAEHVRHYTPGLIDDPHLLFPLSSFVCVEAAPKCNQPPCEVMVFKYLEGCRSVGDLIRMFERTHPMGVLQHTATCAEYRACGTCQHVPLLHSLVVQQSARLSARFQALHGRRHGDFKCDNILLDRGGVPKLADFLTPFCRSCDRREFVTSAHANHHVVQEMQLAFERVWPEEISRSSAFVFPGASALEPGEREGNARLMEALEQLVSASQANSVFSPSSQASLFGPVPDLLGSLSAGWTSPGMSMQAAATALDVPTPPAELQSVELPPLGGMATSADFSAFFSNFSFTAGDAAVPPTATLFPRGGMSVSA